MVAPSSAAWAATVSRSSQRRHGEAPSRGVSVEQGEGVGSEVLKWHPCGGSALESRSQQTDPATGIITLRDVLTDSFDAGICHID